MAVYSPLLIPIRLLCHLGMYDGDGAVTPLLLIGPHGFLGQVVLLEQTESQTLLP